MARTNGSTCKVFDDEEGIDNEKFWDMKENSSDIGPVGTVCYKTDCKENTEFCDDCMPNKITVIEDCESQAINSVIAVTMDKTFAGRLNSLLWEIDKLLMDKRHDYGNSYEIIREDYGKIIPLIRLSDKMFRLKTLIRSTSAPKNESIEDTYKDIIGYCILELLYRKSEE